MPGEPREVPPILFLNDLVRDVGGTFGDVGDISRGCRGNLGNLWKFYLRISWRMSKEPFEGDVGGTFGGVGGTLGEPWAALFLIIS